MKIFVKLHFYHLPSSTFLVYAYENFTFHCLPYSLLRAGRFDRIIEIETPSGQNAIRIIAHYLNNKNVVKNVDVKTIARIMDGHSCAELETVINTGCICRN